MDIYIGLQDKVIIVAGGHSGIGASRANFDRNPPETEADASLKGVWNGGNWIKLDLSDDKECALKHLPVGGVAKARFGPLRDIWLVTANLPFACFAPV